MLLASAVVVWEWLNEHGRWRPYSPAVSHHIEAVIRAGPRVGGSVVLGQVDNRLSPYIIDLQSMHQFRQDTGEFDPASSQPAPPRPPCCDFVLFLAGAISLLHVPSDGRLKEGGIFVWRLGGAFLCVCFF